MSHNLAIVLAFTSIVTTCTSLPDYHKQMSPTQLKSVFHVDNVNAVPHYEVVQLLHHSFDDGVALPEHYRHRRRRSIDTINTLSIDTKPTLKQPHHVKKDLSKNPYYSELKAAANAPGAGGVNSIQQAERTKFIGDLSELNEHNVSFNAFGENLNLTLKRTDGLFKGGSAHTLRMWTVRGEPNATHGLDMQEVLDEDAQSSDQIGEVYQDEANMAAILMRRHLETGDLIMEGSIGHEMVIKPLPHELSPNPDATHHVVYKREAQPLEHLSDFAFMEPDDVATSVKLERLQQRRQRRSTQLDDDEAALEEFDDELENYSAETSRARNKRQVPYTIYPEVLVIIDYDGYRLHGGDNLQVKRYFVSFWNGVDLRYRLLKGPKIRISIAGIIISRGRDATPYLERNRVGRDAIDSAAALTDMGKYLFRERRLPVYDIAVAITKLDMCRRATAYGECNRGTAGFAYVGGACVVNKRLEKVNSVAIIEDTGGFSGIIVAAHEVGHLLGAVHDGSPPPSYLGGPGAQRCRWEDGFIMSDLRHTERGFRWSPCTVQSFHHFLNGDTATCLHNAPHEDSALGRSLPGTLLSLDAQCRRDRGTYACFKDERVCAQLFCFDAQTGYCVAYRPAAEGSTCGNGMGCLDGRCTPLPSNVIPTYRSGNENIGKNNDKHNSKDNDDDENDEDDEENTTREEHHDNDDSTKQQHIKTKTENNINTYIPQKQTVTHLQTNNNGKQQMDHTTFEFLASFLAQNPQWQQLLAQAILQANALTGAAATNDAAELNIVQPQQIDKLPQGMVVVKTSVSSSTSTSYGDGDTQVINKMGGSSSRNNNDSTDSISAKEERHESGELKDFESGEINVSHETTVDRKDDEKNLKINKNTSITEPQQKLSLTQIPPTIETQTPTLTKLTQIQKQQKQIIQTTTQPALQPTQQQANLFQYYTHELRKQLQYYLGLLRARATADSISASDSSSTRGSIVSSNSSSSSNSDGTQGSSNSSIRRDIAMSTPNATIETNNSNYSNIVSVAAKLQQQQQHIAQLQEEQNDDNNDSDDDDSEDDVNADVDADVDDASNEAIDDKQQKRKFPTTTTTSVNAQAHQQHTQRLQQAPPPPSIPTRSSSSNNNNNNNKGLQRPATFIDAYLKKLQSLNTPTDVKTSITATTTSTTMSTSSVVGKSAAHDNETEKRAQVETLGSHFLKRTPYLNSRNSAGSASTGSNSRSSSNSGDDADSVGNSSSSNHSSSSDNNNNTNQHQNRTYKKLLRKQHAQQQQAHIEKATTRSSSGEFRSIRTTTQQPAYVTNYIADNTNSLPRLLDQTEQQQQQQQEQQSSLTKTTIKTATTSSSQQQQKAHKVKTQKLIRRQLLRTQIK